jgi:signal transduction histidine kinase
MEIVDDGPGMSNEVRERIFEPFFSTKTGGVGIGLAMVKSCIDAHNGTISIESKPGGGTKFRIELPMS